MRGFTRCGPESEKIPVEPVIPQRRDRDCTLVISQKCHAIFTREHLATSLCTTLSTHLALDAAFLVDVPIQILDASALIKGQQY